VNISKTPTALAMPFLKETKSAQRISKNDFRCRL
jgi:hypothetical protein